MPSKPRKLPKLHHAVLAVLFGVMLGTSMAKLLGPPAGSLPGQTWTADSHCPATVPIALGAQAETTTNSVDGLKKHYPECYN